MNELPIDVILNSVPPKFRWRQTVSTPLGSKTVMCEGALPPAIEDAVVGMILLVKARGMEIEALKRQLEAAKAPPVAPAGGKRGK